MEELFSIPVDFWEREVEEIEKYFKEQVGVHLPNQIGHELNSFKNRIKDGKNY